jgi:hypothetical protein
MALEDTLAKIYKLPKGSMGKIASTGGPYMQETGAAIPQGMVPGMVRTLEFRDVNQNGIEDRDEGMYRQRDLVPESSLPPKMNVPDAFFARPPESGAVIRNSEIRSALEKALGAESGAAINDAEIDQAAMSLLRPESGAVINENEMQSTTNALMDAARGTSDPEERDGLMRMIEKLQAQSMAPMGEMAQQLAQAGGGEDTALAHLRPGEIVLPPEMMEDPEFESMVENKFNQLGINPEEAVVGMGIASLNESTGLEQFGFFKKIGKKLKKVVKKVAPLAVFVPGIGTALGGALGGLGGLATKGLAKVGLGGLGSALGSAGSALASGIGGLGIPGVSSIAGGATGGFGGIANALTTKSGLLGGGMFGKTGSSFLGGPEAGKGLANRFGLGSGTMSQVEAAQAAEQAQTTLNAMTPDQLASMDPAQLQQLRQTAQTGGANLLDRFAGSFSGSGGGMGGLGGLAGMAGAGALAAGLGKLAYNEAKDAKGVSLSPVVAMDATGRYNLEAEMARRMGQQAPNPVEFGLLPQGTLPELSGGKPREPQPMMYGGAVEDLTGGMARGMMYGGSVMPMAYAEGGNVAMEDFERRNGFIDGPGTETSDDIPAMLSDGEFVMTGQAVRGAGSFDMNNNQGILTLTPNGGPDRDNGTELMYQLMEAFSGQARPA